MIQITTHRHGLVVVASTVDDNRDISTAIGLTAESATRRLIRGLQ